MAAWTVTINGKNIRKDAVEKLAKSLQDKYGEKATVTVRDGTPPESRADRFSAAQGLVFDARSQAEELRDEVQSWFDNLPEAFQQGDKGQQLEEAISQLEEFIGHCEEAENMDVEFPGMYG